MFRVFVNQHGWFGGRRPNMVWWRASKRHVGEFGCKLELWSGTAPEFKWESDQLVISDIFTGSLPRSGHDKLMLAWAQSLQPIQDIFASWRYRLLLQFGNPSFNLGSVGGGQVEETPSLFVNKLILLVMEAL